MGAGLLLGLNLKRRPADREELPGRIATITSPMTHKAKPRIKPIPKLKPFERVIEPPTQPKTEAIARTISRYNRIAAPADVSSVVKTRV